MSTGTQGVVGFWAGVERRFQPAGTTTILDNVVVASRLPVFAGLLAGVNAVVMVILWASFVNHIASHVLLGGFVWSGQIDLRGRRVDAYLLRPPPS